MTSRFIVAMCSILGVFNLAPLSGDLRAKSIYLSAKQRHRGPDWSGVYEHPKALMVHERLAIVDVDNGAQPLACKHHNAPDKQCILAVNGEIYNHEQLEQQLNLPFIFKTKSDCEVILALYQEEGVGFLNKLHGMYAFALYDEHLDRYLIARDPTGIIPLYIGQDNKGQVYVASEMKALTPVCESADVFPPGHYMLSCNGDSNISDKYTRFYNRSWMNNYTDNEMHHWKFNTEDDAINMIRNSLTASVKSHLMSDVPYGVLLSGGLDSSVIAAITKQFIDRRVEDHDRTKAWWPQLHTFSVGLEGSPDLNAAQKVAEHIGSVHHAVIYTEQQGIDALSEVIYHLETYDVTTIRASIPMYLMARKIRTMGIKMVLSGEGSDELFGGYLYFHKAPSAQALHEETVRKLENLHLYDCLRANKAMMAWSIEARVPFLDVNFIDNAMQINPAFKTSTNHRMEKYLLRKAFEDLLPSTVVWRQKEQFSDGVGYSWIDRLQAYAETQVSDDQLKQADQVFPINTPETKEAYLYRTLFASHFSQDFAAQTVSGGKSVACSTPAALAWDKSLQNTIDPSGRAVSGVHQYSYE